VPRLTNEQRIVRQIIKEHGPVIDLKANPELFIEIVRKHASDIADIRQESLPGGVGPVGPASRFDAPDGGAKPGGVGPVGPSSLQSGPRIEDVMKEVLKLQRQVTKLTKQIGP
jgi:hypothetical protein